MFFRKYLQKLKLFPKKQINSIQKYSTLLNSPNADLDKNVHDRYMNLPIPEGKLQATYIWIDGTGFTLRGKSQTLDSSPSTYKEIPIWSFNGHESHDHDLKDSDFYLIPVAMYNDPFRRGKNKLVLCETFDANEKPSSSNHRQKCIEVLNKVCDQEVQIGFGQAFILMDMFGRPFGWPRGEPIVTESLYGGVGASKIFGREIGECFYRSCLYSGIDINGIRPESIPSKWKFQTGPSPSIKAADDLWIARWLLLRITEDFGVDVSFHPKFSDRWIGSGLHTTFSVKKMRENNGYEHIEEAIKKLEQHHKEYIKYVDNQREDNKKRLIGQGCDSHYEKFTWGIADRAASVKVPKMVAAKKKGFFEDRRPGANADPYKIIETLVRNILL